MSSQNTSKSLIYFMMGMMLITGACNTIVMKLQSGQVALGKEYNHSWFQTLFMFIGEALTIFAYMIYNLKYASQNQDTSDQRKEVSPFILAIPAMCDLVGSSLTFLALLMMPGSVYQMIRGAVVFVIALFSYLFLKRRYYRHHYTSLFIVFVGLFLVGLSSVLNSDSKKESESDDTLMGIIVLLISLLFTGFQFISEEKILEKYKAHPLKLVGWEGIWGFFGIIIVVTIMSFIQCGDSKLSRKACTPDEDNILYLETPIFALKQIVDNIALLLLVIGGIFSIALFNFFGISVTKYASASSRAIVDCTRTILIWFFFLVVPTKFQETFSWIQFTGFIITTFGALVYNEIIVIPFFGFDKYTKDALKRKEEEESLLKANDVAPLGVSLQKQEF